MYNNLGQLIITQKEISTADGGQATDKTISFSYDNKGRLISKAGTSKGQTYSFNVTYDPQGRVLSSSESSNGKYFIQKGITYDDKARVISYEKQLYSSGILTKVQIENVYNLWNGELTEVRDKITGKNLWKLNETNAKGQVLKSRLGATDINNSYDANGFLTNVNHSSSVKPSILEVSYSFDAIKNELKSRTTGGDFNIVESFDYDDNNRLINWTNPVTSVKPSANRNVYDLKGIITQNDQVGTIKFENSQKIYQPTGMTLNAAGIQNYSNDLIQSIYYNENNDPVFIDGAKGDVAFRYGLTTMRQRVMYSDKAGNKLEQRYFDAWGNFIHLQIGTGAIITDQNVIRNSSLVIERGYTSHGHFAEVGIIHMNVRLYDPLLRRFLNADENIQDIFNTQIYNKHGYVMNNPLNDPSEEFAWIIIGAVAGAYFIGVKANGFMEPYPLKLGCNLG